MFIDTVVTKRNINILPCKDLVVFMVKLGEDADKIQKEIDDKEAERDAQVEKRDSLRKERETAGSTTSTNGNTTQETTEEENSIEGGDPVRLAIGNFVTSESDLTFQYFDIGIDFSE